MTIEQQQEGVNNRRSFGEYITLGDNSNPGRVWGGGNYPTGRASQGYTSLSAHPHPWAVNSVRHHGHAGGGQRQGQEPVGQGQIHPNSLGSPGIQGFQGLTVQQLLEAHLQAVKLELSRQRQEHNMTT